MQRSVLAIGAMVAGLGVSAAAAQDRTVELKMSFWVPPAHSLVQTATKEWGPSIEKASNGRDCPEVCVWGHDDEGRNIAWLSRRMYWISFWRDAIRRTFLPRMA
jgi:hypothetical protein